TGRKAIGGRWVWKGKYNELGFVTRAKARLVAKGYSQQEELDCFDTYAPTPSSSTIRLLAAFANETNRGMVHFDAEQALIQADIDTEVLVRLNRALYGLKQASRRWNDRSTQVLLGLGFDPSKADPCLFRYATSFVTVHIDDMFVVGTREDCDALSKALSFEFPTNNLGPLSLHTGCVFARDWERGQLLISQTAFINQLCERVDVCSSSPTPAAPNARLLPRQEGEGAGNARLRELIGALIWAADMTRPDISNSVRSLTRSSQDPSEEPSKGAIRVLQYLHGSREQGIVYEQGSGLELAAFADSSFSGDRAGRRYVSGGAVVFGRAAVPWFSRTQRTVALSTSEAEYMAMGKVVKEALFVRNILFFMQPQCGVPEGICVYKDNNGAIDLAKNPLSTVRTKHINVRYHFLGDLVQSKDISIYHVSTERQAADVLTKALEKESFFRHIKLMNL
ncbi:unnamed protein product, partial [Discosporangium mesarthrocarpum]